MAPEEVRNEHPLKYECGIDKHQSIHPRICSFEGWDNVLKTQLTPKMQV